MTVAATWSSTLTSSSESRPVAAFMSACAKSPPILGSTASVSGSPNLALNSTTLTADPLLAERIRMIANHGQRVKYHHDIIGCNSRLDALQAAVLDVKLRHLDDYNRARQAAADYYTQHLRSLERLACPTTLAQSTHVYHQYTLRVRHGLRDALKQHLASAGIPSMIYYPLPLHRQEAFRILCHISGSLDTAEQCADQVLSLPMHTELTAAQQDRIIDAIVQFFKTH